METKRPPSVDPNAIIYAYLQKGYDWLASNKPARALIQFQRAYQLITPAQKELEKEIITLLSSTYKQNGDFSQAIKFINAISSKLQTDDIALLTLFITLAECYYAQSEYLLAIKTLERIINHRAQSIEKQCAEEDDSLLKQFENNSSILEITYKACWLLARIDFEHMRYEKAIKHLTTAKDIDTKLESNIIVDASIWSSLASIRFDCERMLIESYSYLGQYDYAHKQLMHLDKTDNAIYWNTQLALINYKQLEIKRYNFNNYVIGKLIIGYNAYLQNLPESNLYFISNMIDLAVHCTKNPLLSFEIMENGEIRQRNHRKSNNNDRDIYRAQDLAELLLQQVNAFFTQETQSGNHYQLLTQFFIRMSTIYQQELADITFLPKNETWQTLKKYSEKNMQLVTANLQNLCEKPESLHGEKNIISEPLEQKVAKDTQKNNPYSTASPSHCHRNSSRVERYGFLSHTSPAEKSSSHSHEPQALSLTRSNSREN